MQIWKCCMCLCFRNLLHVESIASSPSLTNVRTFRNQHCMQVCSFCLQICRRQTRFPQPQLLHLPKCHKLQAKSQHPLRLTLQLQTNRSELPIAYSLPNHPLQPRVTVHLQLHRKPKAQLHFQYWNHQNCQMAFPWPISFLLQALPTRTNQKAPSIITTTMGLISRNPAPRHPLHPLPPQARFQVTAPFW